MSSDALAVLGVLGGDLLGRRGVAELLDADARMRLLHGGDRGERLVDELLGVLVAARHREVHDDRAAVLGDRVRAVAGSSGLSISVTPLIASRRLHDVLDRGGDLGSPTPLPWMSTCSPACSGKPAAATIMSPRLDSPLPAADSSIVFWPTLPPRTVARTTNDDPAEDGRLAMLRAPSTGACREVAGLHQRGAPSKGAGAATSRLPAPGGSLAGAGRRPASGQASNAWVVAVPARGITSPRHRPSR